MNALRLNCKYTFKRVIKANIWEIFIAKTFSSVCPAFLISLNSNKCMGTENKDREKFKTIFYTPHKLEACPRVH